MIRLRLTHGRLGEQVQVFQVCFETWSWLATVAFSHGAFQRTKSKHADVDSLQFPLPQIWGKVIQAAAQVMIEKKLSLSWRDDLRGESHEPTSSLPVPALVNSSNGFWQLCALMSSPGLWAMGSTGSHSLSLPQPLPPSQTGLSVSSHGEKKKKKKVPFNSLFNFSGVKKAFCFHYVQFRPSSHTLGFGRLESFNYSYYTAWVNQCFLPGHPAEPRKGQHRWRSSAGQSCCEGPQMPGRREEAVLILCWSLESSCYHMEHASYSEFFVTAEPMFSSFPLWSFPPDHFCCPAASLSKPLQIALDNGMKAPLLLAHFSISLSPLSVNTRHLTCLPLAPPYYSNIPGMLEKWLEKPAVQATPKKLSFP